MKLCEKHRYAYSVLGTIAPFSLSRSAVKFSVTPPSVSESGLYGNAEDF